MSKIKIIVVFVIFSLSLNASLVLTTQDKNCFEEFQEEWYDNTMEFKEMLITCPPFPAYCNNEARHHNADQQRKIADKYDNCCENPNNEGCCC